MTASVVVKHNFETAHRLPFLEGKCTSLHGHSWWAEVSVFGTPDDSGVLLEFADLKANLRAWIDRWLDHGTMLGHYDPLTSVLRNAGCKVFEFDPEDGGFCGAGEHGRALPWPTVENVAELVRRFVLHWLALACAGREFSVHVRVQETHVNEATAR